MIDYSKTVKNKIDKIKKGADFAIYKGKEVTILGVIDDIALVYYYDLQKAENAELDSFKVSVRYLTKIQ